MNLICGFTLLSVTTKHCPIRACTVIDLYKRIHVDTSNTHTHFRHYCTIHTHTIQKSLDAYQYVTCYMKT